METIKQIFNRYKKEYFKLKSKKDKKGLTRILDKVVDVTKIVRKSAIRKFKNIQKKDSSAGENRGRKTYYTPDVISALKDVWEVGNGMCGELLYPMIGEYVEKLRKAKKWKNSDEATGKLFAMSMGTMKAKVGNFLKARRKGRGFSLTSPSNLKHIIPIFTGPWRDELPGSGQIDTVAHCGSTLLGSFAYSLNYVDISTLWIVTRGQWNKGQEATVENIEYIRKHLPFLLSKIHPDTGSEFINWHCKKYCDANKIEMTRSRPNHKNDNGYVEERNGHVIRRYVGYIRLDCRESVGALNDLYEVLCLYLNHFIPSRKCIEKIKINSKYKKAYEKVAKTPYQRVLENIHISDEIKKKLKVEHEELNPFDLKKKIEKLQTNLYNMQKKLGSQKSNSQN